MIKELEDILKNLRPAFSRKATYFWFVIVFAGFVIRADTFGVSSIVRALLLMPSHYPSLINFFHSTAWDIEGLMSIWWQRLNKKNYGYMVNGRLVLVGDHTKVPKDGRKMPAVTTLHQDSETGSKPSYFRGHHWGCVGMVTKVCGRFLATPLWATIQEGLENIDKSRCISKTIQMIQMAGRISTTMGRSSYLVLDAYFSVGSVFIEASMLLNDGKQVIHILTRAKKNIVAFHPAPKATKKQRGRKKKYCKKIKLMKLFDSQAKQYQFQTSNAVIYNGKEKIRHLVLDLLWKPTKGMLRFILIESSHGRMILITSDMNLQPVTAVELYCRRVTIETMFDVLKNTLGGLEYRFWSSYLTSAPRKPRKNIDNDQYSKNPKRTKNTLEAIEKFVNIQLLVIGILHLLAKTYPVEVVAKARCWLRTKTLKIPSEFVTRMALTNELKFNLSAFGKSWITDLIRSRQEYTDIKGVDRMAG